MNKYSIYISAPPPKHVEEIGVVEAACLKDALKTFFKQTSRIVPGAWAVPYVTGWDHSLYVDAMLKEPPPNLPDFLEILLLDNTKHDN